MTIKPEFYRTLEHLGQTSTMAQMWNEPKASLCGLRHDIDYDIDVALEMAHAEWQVGCKSTYFLLPTAGYWHDTTLIEKCRQLADYGHEVGLHVNLMAEFITYQTDDISFRLNEQLQRLRESGLKISGIAAHGDKQCYKHNVSNYWCFSQLKPEDPMSFEDGRTAEGPYEPDGKPRLRYSASHAITRNDGKSQEFWSLDFEDFKIDYHAWHISHDRYFSDSGGSWYRTPDPLEYERKNERWQVLIHPIHWLGKPKTFFFLSTARSGSKYVTNLLNVASPVNARHEHILNEDFDAGRISFKPTSAFRELQCDEKAIKKSLTNAWQEIEASKTDVAEVNVYLSSLIDPLQQAFPAANYVHLYRDPFDVARSMKMRGWYDTPTDHAHAAIESANPYSIDQFERILTHVAETNTNLINNTANAIALEDISNDVDEAVAAFAKIGIVLHRRLAEPLMGKAIDRTSASDGIDFIKLPIDLQRVVVKRLSDFLRRYFFERYSEYLKCDESEMLHRDPQPINLFRKSIPIKIERILGVHATIRLAGTDIDVIPDEKLAHSRVMLGGSDWRSLKKTNQDLSGWPINSISFIEGHVTVQIPAQSTLSLYFLCYDLYGNKIYDKRLCTLDAQRQSANFSCSPHPEATHFDFAFYIPKDRKRGKLSLLELEITSIFKDTIE